MKKMVRTPAKLDSCKITWPFQDAKTHKNLHMCVKCKADAPLALAIAVNGKRVIWICNANRFRKKEGCENWLSWLGTDRSLTGMSTKTVCLRLRQLVSRNKKAAEMFDMHNKHLKLGQETKPASLYQNSVRTTVNIEKLTKKTSTILGATTILVEKTILAASLNPDRSFVFVVDAHSVRSCGIVQGQPLLCLDNKRSKCIWSQVVGDLSQFQQGKGLPNGFKLDSKKSRQNQPCSHGTNSIRIATAIRL